MILSIILPYSLTLVLNNQAQQKTSMDHMLNLPFDVLRVGIFPLLKEKDMSCLDIAVSSQLLRSLLWEALRFSHFASWSKDISLPKLEWLHTRGIKLFRIDSLDTRRVRTPMIELTRHCPLTHLRITGSCSRLTGEGLVQMCRNMPNLVELYLVGFQFLSDPLVTVLAQNLSHLVHLSLKCCNRVSPAGLVAVSKYCRSLETLDIGFSSRLVGYGAVDSLIGCIGHFSSTLKSLNVGIAAFQVNRYEGEYPEEGDDAEVAGINDLQMVYPWLNIIRDFAIYNDSHFANWTLGIDCAD